MNRTVRGMRVMGQTSDLACRLALAKQSSPGSARTGLRALHELSQSTSVGRELLQRAGRKVLVCYVALCQMHIAFRHVQRGMAHDPLQGNGVSTSSQELRGKAVPKGVGVEPDAELPPVHLQPVTPGRIRHRSSLAATENGNTTAPRLVSRLEQSPDGLGGKR